MRWLEPALLVKHYHYEQERVSIAFRNKNTSPKTKFYEYFASTPPRPHSPRVPRSIRGFATLCLRRSV